MARPRTGRDLRMFSKAAIRAAEPALYNPWRNSSGKHDVADTAVCDSVAGLCGIRSCDTGGRAARRRVDRGRGAVGEGRAHWQYRDTRMRGKGDCRTRGVVSSWQVGGDAPGRRWARLPAPKGRTPRYGVTG